MPITTKTTFTAEELEKARKARNAAHREWAKRNPEKIKAARIRHWLRKAQLEETGAAK